MASIFTKIVKGEIPCHKIAENEDFLAFLDIEPCAPGHCLVIPKKEIDYIFDLEDSMYLGLMAFAKSIEPALKKTIPCKKIGMAVVGLEVPHVHIHLIPLNSIKDMDFTKKIEMSSAEIDKIAEKVRANF